MDTLVEDTIPSLSVLGHVGYLKSCLEASKHVVDVVDESCQRGDGVLYRPMHTIAIVRLQEKSH